MTAVRLETCEGVIPIDDFGDDEVSVPIDLPPLDKRTVAFIVRVQDEARAAVADATHRTSEKIAQFLEQHRCNLHPDNAAAKVRSLEWDL